jgi:hypothetical protein
MGLSPSVTITTTKRSIQIRVRQEAVVVTYQEPGCFTPDELELPITFLDGCEGSRDDAVTLEATDDKTIRARWSDSGIAQTALYDRPTKTEASTWPKIPRKLAENPGQLLTALRDASDTTDAESTRYALGHIQLRPKRGEITATDGRQLLVQRGFVFPWKEDVLISRSGIFGHVEFQAAETVSIGYTDGWVTLSVGRWTLQFAANKTGRFPRTDDVLRPAASACSSCQLSPADMQDLQRLLPLLPAADESDAPVTIDLNGHFAVRARAARVTEPVEIKLADGRPTGEPIRIATNRCYLQRAAKLGLPGVHIFGADAALLAADEQRSYVWMPLPIQGIVPPVREAEPESLRAAA